MVALKTTTLALLVAYATPLALLCAAPLADDAIKAKLAAMKNRRTRAPARRPVPVGPPSTSAPAPPPAILAGTEASQVPVWSVPPELRMPGAPVCASHGRHVALDDVFPNVGLGEAWERNAALRTALRTALRADLFRAPATWNEKQRRAATGLDAACMVAWTTARESSCDTFSAAFAAHGISLSGREFLLGLGGLCGNAPHGSLIDIVPLARRVAHSWHQDSGISSNTVLLGFPPRDGYAGGGVFSSHVKLSHPLRPSEGDTHGRVVEYERFENSPHIDERFVLRPLYGRGREIWVSDDSTHLHSTPDAQLRECVWRFM